MSVPLARVLSFDCSADLALAQARIGRPVDESARRLTLLLTGLSDAADRFLWREGFDSGDHARRPGSGVLFASQRDVEELRDAARERGGVDGLADALDAALRSLDPPTSIQLGPRRFELGRATHLVGVVNVTPDSFSDGGQYLSADAAVEHGLALVREGADVLDVGGESTRPGASAVDAQEELRRVVPVIRALHERVPEVPISIDTTKVAVARAAVDAGASLINDVSGLGQEPALAELAAATGAGLCLMHMQGTPRTMQVAPRYDDVVEEVLAFLSKAKARAVAAGVDPAKILVDPGIGFGKTLGHNLILLRRLGDLRLLGSPILLGTSRKSFLGALTGGKPPGERLSATLGSVTFAAACGTADFVRVHDVAEVRDALIVADAVRAAAEGGALFAAGR